MDFEKRASLIQDIVVVANPKTLINDRCAPEDIRQKIIRHDQLINFIKKDMENKKDSWWIPERRVMCIAETLIQAHEPLTVDYNKKYGLEENIQEIKKSVESPKEQEVEQNIEMLEVVANQTESDKWDEELLIVKLKKYRLEKSKAEGIKPYLVYNNKEMMSIIEAKPKNIEELMKVGGFGKVKCEKYGEDIMRILAIIV